MKRIPRAQGEYDGKQGVVIMQKCNFFLIAIAVAILLGGTAAGADTTPAPQVPKAMVPNPTHTFESVLEGQEVSHRFQIFNKGDAELKIFNVRTD